MIELYRHWNALVRAAQAGSGTKARQTGGSAGVRSRLSLARSYLMLSSAGAFRRVQEVSANG